MKTKIISVYGNPEQLELEINNFIEGKEVIDIKFNSSIKYTNEYSDEEYTCVLIMYK